MGHPTACAAALAVQRKIQSLDLLANVRKQGDDLDRRLLERLGNHAHVGDIRGRGLFRGIELVADRATKEPFDPALKLHARIKKHAMGKGLICYPGGGTADGIKGDHVLLAPPFIIEEPEIEELVNPSGRLYRRRPCRGMLKDWFLGKVHPRALESSTKEVKAFVDGLKAMSDEDIGTIIAVATLIRINFETHGVIPEDVFEAGPLPKVEALGGYQLAINRLARKFKKMGLADGRHGRHGLVLYAALSQCSRVARTGAPDVGGASARFPPRGKGTEKGRGRERGGFSRARLGEMEIRSRRVSATREPPET